MLKKSNSVFKNLSEQKRKQITRDYNKIWMKLLMTMSVIKETVMLKSMQQSSVKLKSKLDFKNLICRTKIQMTMGKTLITKMMIRKVVLRKMMVIQLDRLLPLKIPIHQEVKVEIETSVVDVKIEDVEGDRTEEEEGRTLRWFIRPKKIR